LGTSFFHHLAKKIIKNKLEKKSIFRKNILFEKNSIFAKILILEKIFFIFGKNIFNNLMTW